MELMYPTDNPYVFEVIRGADAIDVRKRKGWAIVSPKDLGKRLRKIRNRLNLLQEEMVYLINDLCLPTFHTNLRQYQRWEMGRSLKRFMTLENLYTLSDSLHVPMSYLCGATKKIPPVWTCQSPLVSPEKALKAKPGAEVDLRMYKVNARHRGEDIAHIVLAESQNDARKYFLNEFHGAEIRGVKITPRKAGVIT